jgi:uncharacterized protein YggE
MRRVTMGVMVLAIGMALPALAQDTGDLAKQPVIVTRGEASVKRAPDQAWVSIAAESRASGPAEAQRQNAEAMRAVTDALAKAGLPAAAVRTTGYSVQPDLEYTNGRSRVRGYIARNQVEARVDDLSKLGGVLDAAGVSGATSMSGLRFDLVNRAAVEREALQAAVQDAMARAKAIAAGAGVTVGPIVRIDDQYQSSPPMYAMGGGAGARLAAAAPETPISSGELEVRAEVTLTVTIR